MFWFDEDWSSKTFNLIFVKQNLQLWPKNKADWGFAWALYFLTCISSPEDFLPESFEKLLKERKS